MGRSPDIVEKRFPATAGEEANARDLIGRVAAECGFSPERIEDIRTAVNEASLNALEHSDASSFAVRYSLHNDRLIVEISNSGQPFRLLGSAPNLGSKMDGNEPARGWGLYLIRTLCDHLSMTYRDGVNIVHMEFEIVPASARRA